MTQPTRQDTISIREVVTRDGFQMESRFVPTPVKIALIDRLSKLGLAAIEVTSFSNPARIPMLADAVEVLAGIAREPGVRYVALVPNLKGARRATQSAVDEFNLVMSVSERHNQANMRMGREASFAQLVEVIDLAADSGVAVNVSLSTAFGCPFEGRISASEVHRWVERFAGAGVTQFTICDTTGMANPAQVAALSRSLLADHPGIRWVMHFHDTRGMGLANVLASADQGITAFDASLGGLGGCPYAPGASGNVCTEDVVHMLEECGYRTAVDLDGLLEAARELQKIVARPLPSHLLSAGPVQWVPQPTT